MKTRTEHNALVEQIANQIKEYSTSHKHKKLRFYHGSTNSTREQTHNDEYYFIDISNMNGVIEINTEEKYALVEPNVSMDQLVKTTLQYGLLPPVVMEFPGITAGGAVNGATLEASSYKFGQFNDNCESYEIILGNGDIVEVSEKKHKDLFYGISGAYGSLGLLTLMKVKLIPVSQFVHTTFTPSGDYKQTLHMLNVEIKNGNADFIDSIILDPISAIVLTGRFIGRPDARIETFSKATDEWFYERAEKVINQNKAYEEIIPIFDFLFRYNRGAYWMGEYVFPKMHLPSDRITKFILNPFMNTRKLYDGLHAMNISQNYFIQDFYCPFDKALDLLEFSEKHLYIFPIWLCPIKPANGPQKLSPSYIKDNMLLDVGIWGQSKQYLADPIGMNKLFEDYTKNIDARKMLYAHSYYSQEEFWSIYDKEWYDDLRKEYFAGDVLPDVWEKTHVGNRKYKPHILHGAFQLLLDTMHGKHLNT